MNIRKLTQTDLDACVNLYMKAYNAPPWSYNWTYDKALKYLAEYVDRTRFVGFVLLDEGEIVGAMFGHSKTWWTQDLLYVDELFVSPAKQRSGYGKRLLDYTEDYAREQGYEVITLMTNKYMPAMKFYSGINYIHAEHFVFLFKPL
ncbi:MAG: GNAT family N-acetyltransferase [Mucilaginibacter sp.]|jgi:ribosomal protein S18 acetylase RimI-like enzyme